MPSPRFEFASDAVTDGYFTVVSFTGKEVLSQLFEYEIELKAAPEKRPADDFLDQVLAERACLRMLHGDDVYPVYGMLSQFVEKQTVKVDRVSTTYYRATLVPRLWRLTLNRTSQVYYQNADADGSALSVLDILHTVLDHHDLDYDTANVTGDLLQREYRCQFNETDFDFLSRLLENEGIFYRFAHGMPGPDGTPKETDTLIFSDSLAGAGFADPEPGQEKAGKKGPDRSELRFDSAPSGDRRYESVFAWSCRRQRLPAEFTVRDYDPRSPSLYPTGSDTIGSANGTDDTDVTDDASTTSGNNGTNGQQKQYLYGEHLRDQDEAEHIASIRAQEVAVEGTRYYGESGACGLRAGRTFSIDKHPTQRYNAVDAYLLSEVHHEGSDLDAADAKKPDDDAPHYTNSFVAIEETVQFRPRRVTPRPRFHGTMTGFVYSESPGEYADVDDEGRYRVRLPFPNVADGDVRASHRLRMAQPYAGVDPHGQVEGSNFPLMPDTEVLLTFVNGDPDRPIIAGAVPNVPPPLLTGANSNQSITGTHGMYRLEARGGAKTLISANAVTPGDPAFKRLNADGTSTGEDLNEESGAVIVTRRSGDEYVYTEGQTFSYGSEKIYSLGNDFEELHENENGIDAGEVFDMTPLIRSVGTRPDGMNYATWVEGENGLVEKNWGSKCEFHQGRMFSWVRGFPGTGSLYETFNYGPTHTENLIGEPGGTSDTIATYQTHEDRWDYTNGMTWLSETGGLTGVLGIVHRFVHGVVDWSTDWLLDPNKDRSGLARATALDPALTASEKVFGHTYNYQMGLAVDIHEGNSISRTYGNTEEVVKGDAESVVRGDSYSTVTGLTSEFLLGGASEMIVGGKAETQLAWTHETYGGVKTAICVAGDIGLFLGLKTEFMFGFDTGLQMAGFLKYTGGFGIDKTSGRLDSTDAKLEQAGVVFKKISAELKSHSVTAATYGFLAIS